MTENEQPSPTTNLKFLEFVNGQESSYTPALSGALYLSGGALIYVGSAGTITQLGAA